LPLDADVLALGPRDLGLDDPRVLGLLEVDERRPRDASRAQRASAQELVEHPIHLPGHVLELGERVPALFGALLAPGGQDRHSSSSFLSPPGVP